ISQANQEQASAVAEVRIAIQQMDEMTQHNAALVQQTNAAIEQTETQASYLDGIVEIFTIAEPAISNPISAHIQQPASKVGSRPQSRAYLMEGSSAVQADWSEF